MTSLDKSDKSYKSNKELFDTKMAIGTGIGLVGLGLVGFAFTRYKTAKSNEWLVRTGLGIKDMQIGKQYIQWPFQNIEYISLSPQSYKFSVNAMSKEKMEFTFPAVFTIGIKNKPESLENFSRYLLNQEDLQIDGIIRGIIEGDVRTLSANLSIEDIFTGRSAFKDDVVNNVQKQLDQYGLEIYNANMEELKDGPGSNYFESLSQKIQAEAQNKAKVDVAEQNKKGNIGSKEREGETRQQLAIIEFDAVRLENEKRQQTLTSNSDLDRTRIQQQYLVNQEEIRTQNDLLLEKLKREKEVEISRAQMETEKKRAEELSATQVQAEMEAKKAEGEFNSQKIKTDAKFYTTQKEAEAQFLVAQKKADAMIYSKLKEAEAMIYSKLKEAEGIEAIYNAQAKGLSQVLNSFGGDKQALISYTMMDKGIYENIAKSNADAIRGLEPKITVWTNDASNSLDAIQNLSKAVIPMLSTIEGQTGYKLPEWMIKQTKDD